MTDPRTDEDRIRGIVQATNMGPIPTTHFWNQNVQDESSFDTIAASGGNETVSFTPPSGKIWVALAVRAIRPTDASATSGDHTIEIFQMQNEFGIKVKANYDAKVGFKFNSYCGSKVNKPATDQGAIQVIQNMFALNSSPIKVYYQNNTDAANDKDGTYVLFYQEMDVPESQIGE